MSNAPLVDNLKSGTARLDDIDAAEFLSRRAAGAWLQRYFNFGSEKVLARKSWDGTGPISFRMGGKVLYRPADLREWAMAQISPEPVTSSADNKARKARKAASSGLEAQATA